MADILGFIQCCSAYQSQPFGGPKVQLLSGTTRVNATRVVAGFPLTDANYHHSIVLIIKGEVWSTL